MAQQALSGLLRHLRSLIRTPENALVNDRQLLNRFVREHDETAFAEVVRRHGPLVYGICGRVLADSNDVQDAFQAAFLVLVRKAGSVSWQDSVAGWLYRVAFRAALKIKASARRRSLEEDRAIPMARNQAVDDPAWLELRAVLDEELSSLPEKYRTPLVLCDLQGRSHEEAAGELGWPMGSMSRRLAKARELLRSRLTKRGVTLSSAALLALLGPQRIMAAVPTSLAQSTIQSGVHLLAGTVQTAAVSGAAMHTANALVRDMFWAKLKLALAICFTASALGVAAGIWSVGIGKPADTSTDNVSQSTATTLQFMELDQHGPVHALAFSPDGQLLAVGDGMAVRIWNASTGEEIQRLKGHHHSVHTLAFSADGKWLASGGADPYLLLWPTSDWQAHRLPVDTHGVTTLTFASHGRLLAYAGKNSGIHFWAGKDQRLPKDRHPPKDRVLPKTDRPLPHLPGHAKGVTKLAFAPKGNLLASVGNDHIVRVWNVHNPQAAAMLRGHHGKVTSLAFSPRVDMLATGSLDHTIRFWDPLHGKEGHHPIKDLKGVHCLAIGPEGKTIYSGGIDGVVRRWEMRSGKLLDELAAHSTSISTLSLTPDGKRLASGTCDGKVRIHHLK